METTELRLAHCSELAHASSMWSLWFHQDELLLRKSGVFLFHFSANLFYLPSTRLLIRTGSGVLQTTLVFHSLYFQFNLHWLINFIMYKSQAGNPMHLCTMLPSLPLYLQCTRTWENVFLLNTRENVFHLSLSLHTGITYTLLFCVKVTAKNEINLCN